MAPHSPLRLRDALLTAACGIACAVGAACGSDDAPLQGPERPTRADAGTDGADTGGRRPIGSEDAAAAADTADPGTGEDRDAIDPTDPGQPDAVDPPQPDVTDPPQPDATGPPLPGDPCDEDRDGFRSIACGGDDCDDTNPRIYPGAPEACDFVDQDCDGVLNNGIECLIYAHTSNELFLVDPFNGTTTRVTSTPSQMFDFDTAPDGGLYGIAGSSLYRFQPGSTNWDRVGSFSGVSPNPNGFAIDNAGVGWVTGGTRVWRMDISDASTVRITDNTGFTSSGDCVVDKGDVLYMSAASGSVDDLVIIDGSTGAATRVGSIGFGQVYGLASAWGTLFGFTSRGELIEIDTSTGRGTLRHTLRDAAGRAPIWYGSASSPGR